MQSYFNELADFLTAKLSGEEVLLMNLSGEESDFVRFNKSLVRQAGSVQQTEMGVELIRGSKHASAGVALMGVRDEDRAQLLSCLSDLRERIEVLPEDPHLLYATEGVSSEDLGEDQLTDAGEVVDQILAAGVGHDLVGIYAGGAMYRGFANSLGQRNWYRAHSFNFDWSMYLRADKAVKSGYAGYVWDPKAFTAKVDAAAEQLEVLERDSIKIDPGDYRVYLAPAAVADYLGMLGWGGWGLKDHRTKQTALLPMIESGATLHPSVTILEDTAGGIAPNFDQRGFAKPNQVQLIEEGTLQGCMISPRSAKEFGVATNGANGGESPNSLSVSAGDLPMADVLKALDTGVCINNVWYLNYSDRPSCRITGMTRFACFWVEKGEIVAPLDVMRFDETLFRAFGSNLISLTKEREMIFDAGTYEERSSDTAHVPGALIEDFHFNL